MSKAANIRGFENVMKAMRIKIQMKKDQSILRILCFKNLSVCFVCSFEWKRNLITVSYGVLSTAFLNILLHHLECFDTINGVSWLLCNFSNYLSLYRA